MAAGGRFCCGREEEEDAPLAGRRKPSTWWCVRGDYCAYFAVFFVYLSLASIYVSTVLFCIVPMFGHDTLAGVAHITAFSCVVALVLASHVGASLSQPGLVPQQLSDSSLLAATFNQQLAEMEKDPSASDLDVRRFKRSFCRRCRVPKPRGAHHCSTCNRCVQGMDHHCPWINNCVGQGNLKMFLLFLSYTALGTAYSIFLFALRLFSLIQGNSMRAKIAPQERSYYLALIGFCSACAIAAIFFFCFVLCMCRDQYDALTTGVPGVDSMQYAETEDIPWKHSVCRGFRLIAQRNERFGWRWFLPVPAVEEEEKEE